MRKKNVLSMSINLSLNLLQRSCRCHQYHNASYMNVLQIRKRISSISSFPLQYCRVCDYCSDIVIATGALMHHFECRPNQDYCFNFLLSSPIFPSCPSWYSKIQSSLPQMVHISPLPHAIPSTMHRYCTKMQSCAASVPSVPIVALL